jgi:hypothetical protein
MKRKLIVAVVTFVFAVASVAAPFPTLAGAYSQGNGCVFLLLEMSLPNPGVSLGRVAFTHNDVSANSGTLWWGDYSAQEWGTYGFNGTGINWATGTAWSEWSTFWAPWGDWWN